jgi:hypothetical protein
MRQTALFATVNRPPSQSAPVAAASTIFSTGFWKGWLALCVLLLFSLTAAAQTTYTVTRLDDTNTTDGNGYPGIGFGIRDQINADWVSWFPGFKIQTWATQPCW